MPKNITTEDKRSRAVTLSFKKMLDMIDAHTGEDALSGFALDAPINLML